MSEKIYACLLRLFPSHFRESYGDEALQLFRDRARDEKGFFPRVRLWLDLLADLATSVPRQYRYVRPALAGAAAQQRLDGAPAFFVLVDRAPGSTALIFGCALSMIALSLLSILLSHSGNHRPSSASIHQREHATDSRVSALDQATGQILPHAENAKDVIANADVVNPREARYNHSQSKALLPPDSPRLPNELPPQLQDAAERKRLLNAVIDNLKKHYVDPDAARKTADALLTHEKNGDDDKVADGGAFADLLTKQMREASHDMHLEVVYSQAPLPNLLPEPTAEDLARYRKALEHDNCTFEKVEILPHNIGYLKLNAFPDPRVCRATATAAMTSLNHADAIIFDLRDNRGGYSSMVSQIAAYLFDHPEYMYDPRESPTQQSWTLSPVAGNRLADKPVYVLTSHSTVSAAEQFCYDLKMLKRVTLVGETTRGSAHAGVFHRIDDHFGMRIPETKAINPFSTTDWEGVGVEPDIKVNAAQALETAEKLGENRLQKK
jgi:Peptidase family S41/N-terminal domain of Peptidase_S41 in eukaryotic IRBP